MSTRLWDLHPATWISQGLSQQRPSDVAAMAGWALSIHLLAPWKAVTWLPQHPTRPSRSVMADGGESRPQTQSHCPKGASCKSGHTFRIKFGRWLQCLQAQRFLQHGQLVQHGPSPMRPPLWAPNWESVPQHLLAQTWGWEGRVKRSPLL